jgi:hypothetical protein
MLKIVTLNCDPRLCQVTGIAQTTSELRRFLPDPPVLWPHPKARPNLRKLQPPCKYKDPITAFRIAGFGKAGGYLGMLKRAQHFANDIYLDHVSFSILMNLIPQNCFENGGAGV